MWQDLYIHSISAENFFCQAWKLFSADIWKMLECHFWTYVMLRQSRVGASRASPAQRSQDLRVVYSKNLFKGYIFCLKGHLVQGQSTQTVFSKLALRDRNMQVRLFWKVVLKFWGLRNFASATSFHEMYTVCHLQSNL